MARSMRQEIKAWMIGKPNMNASMPMEYNEIIDSAHAQNVGYYIATLAYMDGA